MAGYIIFLVIVGGVAAVVSGAWAIMILIRGDEVTSVTPAGQRKEQRRRSRARGGDRRRRS
jgi:hypothetical protein